MRPVHISGATFPVFTKTLIAAMLAVALHTTAQAQGRRPPAPPPVVSQTVTMQRGGKITVPLGIHGTRGEMLEFLIRTPPAFGKLSAVQKTGMNSAAVTYTPSARNAAGEDRFSYAVRGSEGVSAPGVITIHVVEPVVAAAKMKAPAELEFPPVFPGQRSTVEMELANEGGGVLEGEVAVPEPWSIEGLKIFKIAAGKSATFKIVFTPAQSGVRTGEAVISGTERKIIPLSASAEERLVAAPALLKLTAQPGSQTRMGVLNIANRSDEDANIVVEAGARLMTDRAVKIPARGKAAVPVFADAATGAAFDDAVKLSCNGWKASVPVHVVAVGAILKFTGDEVSIAGSVPASGVAILENSGGEAVTVRLDVGRPFEIETRVVTAPPRGSVEIPILVRDPVAGKFHSSLQAAGEGGSAAVPVSAEISEPATASAVARTSPEPVEKTAGSAVSEIAPQENGSPSFPHEIRELPNALGKFARGTGMHSARLDWPATLGPVAGARIEERVLSISEKDELEIAWSRLADASIMPGGDRVTAELRGLKPGTLYTVRVVTGKDADTSVLFTSDFRTVAKKPFYSGSLLTPFLVLSLLALLYAIWRSRREPEMAKK